MRIIAGSCKGTKLEVAPQTTRPTSDRLKGSLFNSLFQRCDQQVWLDLFAGSGAIGLEALSRGAEQVVFNELHYQPYLVLNKNIKKCHMVKQSVVHQKDAHDLVLKLQTENLLFDVVYCDPPYDMNIQQVLDEVGDLIKEAGVLVIEQEKNAASYHIATPFQLIKARVVGQSRYQAYRKG